MLKDGTFVTVLCDRTSIGDFRIRYKCRLLIIKIKIVFNIRENLRHFIYNLVIFIFLRFILYIILLYSFIWYRSLHDVSLKRDNIKAMVYFII